jgi:radical SAM family uncharacterized protein
MIEQKLEEILLEVQKPGRYIGGELNSVVKDKKNIDVRFAFCFPDVYEVGMSHIGMKILYGLFNTKPYIWCERVFAPWVDMERKMRERNIPLFALESGDNVCDFDFIGFTVQYELCYTNLLNMLDLAGIPMRSRDRTGLGQIVVAGGPCTYNPEPLADFIDIFFIGEGEESGLEVIKLYREFKKQNKKREEFLLAVSQISGVYVPSLYEICYHENGEISACIPKNDAPKNIKKRIIKDLNYAYYPEKFVVPMIDIVHNRAVSEIFRGCIRGCRFCQAGFVYRPVREKSPEIINRQCQSLCNSTGYDEISLSSLSSSDYTKIEPLLDVLTEWAQSEHVGISVPSLRVDGFSNKFMEKLKAVKKCGLTFAPEAGTQRLRDAINKNVSEQELLKTCNTAFSGGWSLVKLYFMIGLPTESKSDIEGIADLAQKVVDVYYSNPIKQKGRAVRVTVSASCFIPKPFTPFQWEAQDSIDQLEQKQKWLRDAIESKSKKIKFNWHDAKTSFLEGVFARGDRKLCEVLEKAQQNGCRFDGWSEHFDFSKWIDIFNQCAIDPNFYTKRRDFHEVLPWNHIDCGVKRSFLKQECERAYKSETTANCREVCSACGAAVFGGGICYGEC